MAEQNSTNSSSQYSTLIEVLNRPKVALTTVFLLVLISCTLVGNSFVILTIFSTRRLRCPAYFFVASLAVADFLVGLFVLPISLAYHLTFEMEGRWILGSFTCKAWLLANFWFCSASTLNLCLVSWDRYIAVTSPLHYNARMSDTKVRNMIIISWISSFSLSVTLIAKAHFSIGEKTNCTIHEMDNPVFTFLGVLLVFLIPVLFLVFVNGRVWLTARRHIKRITALKDTKTLSFNRNEKYSLESRGGMKNSYTISIPALQRGRDSSNDNTSVSSERGVQTLTTTIKEEIKTFRTFLIVIGVFVICWSPFYASMVADIFHSFNSFSFYVTILLGYCNSTMNIFIYGVFNKKFRKAMKKTIVDCCRVKLERQ